MPRLQRLSLIRGIEETTTTLLPAALIQCGVSNSDAWREYALFVTYDLPNGTKGEYCLNFSESPMQRLRQLKEEKRNPGFLVKHISDIPSPVILAQSKGKEKARVETSPGSSSCDSSIESPKWHGVMNEDACSFGIAVFPYTAKQKDELDIELDDTVIVISRAQKGWWLVQRYASSEDDSTPRRGMVPSGCFIESNIPPLYSRSRGTHCTRSLTIPFSDVRTRCRRVVVLADYTTHSEGELSVLKGEMVNEYKRYYNWSYVIKLENGERGWVPMWMVGSKE